MSAPVRWFVREWTPDPTEQGPDEDEDVDCATEASARSLAAQLRKAGHEAGAFERRNIRPPEFLPVGIDPHDVAAHLWEWDSVQLDKDGT